MESIGPVAPKYAELAIFKMPAVNPGSNLTISTTSLIPASGSESAWAMRETATGIVGNASIPSTIFLALVIIPPLHL
jgi:hypothetical protein